MNIFHLIRIRMIMQQFGMHILFTDIFFGSYIYLSVYTNPAN